MAHPKSKKVYWCHWKQHTIMASYCEKCIHYTFNGRCKFGNDFNDCKIISNNNQKDIDKAYK